MAITPQLGTTEKQLSAPYKYPSRLTAPLPKNKYYNTEYSMYQGEVIHGYSTAIIGNIPKGASNRTGQLGLNVLPNCVGYAFGRFNEIVNQGRMVYLSPVNAGDFMNVRRGCEKGMTPKLGACMVWKDSQGPGHVAIVEKINSDGSIVTSESEWNGSYFKTYTRKRGSDGNWIDGCGWMESRRPRYTFQGFIYNPAVPDYATPITAYQDEHWDDYYNNADLANANDLLNDFTGASQWVRYEYEDVEEEIEVTRARTVEHSGVLNQTKSASLLTYPTNVETPFIILKVGDFTFGTYNAITKGSTLRITYPNFIKGMEVVKINGQLNQYTIQLVYQIQQNDDPNLLDKVFSSAGYGATVKISYGDYSSPNLIYKEEEAIITKLTSNIDFSASRITYTLNCTSSALGLMASSYSFDETFAKPSDIIKNVLFNGKYGLNTVFTGMKTRSQVEMKGWIASNDKTVRIEPQENIDPLSYINYLVTCMVCESNSDNAVLLDSSYYLTLVDDAFNEEGGPHFTVKQIYSNSKTIHNQDVYEVDVGYPSDAMVMSFNIRDDNSWSLLYNYNESLQRQEYVYNIDADGNVIQEYSPAFSTSGKQYITTPSQKTWWTQVTSFPISATLVIKGLVRPAMLMSYVKVNSFFYGHRHISSGIYFVTKQVDRVNGSGYRTELSLTRFAGDEDYIRKEKEKVKYTVAKRIVEIPEATKKQATNEQLQQYINNMDQSTRDQLAQMAAMDGSSLPYGVSWNASWEKEDTRTDEEKYMEQSSYIN